MMNHRKIIWGLFLFILLPGCSSPDSDVNSEQDDLKNHQQVWQKQEITDYRFTISISCFCPQGLSPATVIIRNDTVSSVLNPKTGKTLRAPNSDKPVLEQLPDYYPTIKKLFGIINNAIDQNYVRLSVEYNQDYGFPERIELEQSKKISDDAVTYTVSDFEPLESAK